MDTGSFGPPCLTDRKIRVTTLAVDTTAGKICVVRCIHEKGGKA